MYSVLFLCYYFGRENHFKKEAPVKCETISYRFSYTLVFNEQQLVKLGFFLITMRAELSHPGNGFTIYELLFDAFSLVVASQKK